MLFVSHNPSVYLCHHSNLWFSFCFSFSAATGLLCVWVHASCVCHSDHCHCLCDDCGDILLAECWELSLAMDFILLCCLYCPLCIPVLNLLLSNEDQNVWLLPDQLLFWIHIDVLSWFGNTMWCCWIFGLQLVCQENLQKYQVRLVLK